jgi:argininosuccinate lyase
VSPLWHRSITPNPWLETFLAGEDYRLDQRLVVHDCRGSLAHARMLHGIGILNATELSCLESGLAEIAALAELGEFPITPQDEDGHTAIEHYLTARCGEAGKKIHTGRSRNDQVLTALRLWEKEQIGVLTLALDAYIESLDAASSRAEHVELPGYTHMQAAMPTSVPTWLGSYVAAARDDREILELVLRLVDQCPLGTAAGFGVPVVRVDRERVAEELGFARVQENPMYAQLSRGRMEAFFLSACSQVAHGLNRLASDLLLFSTREFGFVVLPESLCTGSSLMPQKRNADVLEIVRGTHHVVHAEQTKVQSLTASLISGYNRDVQLTKGPLFAGVAATLDALRAMILVLNEMRIDEEACKAALTDELYATERALTLVARGVPFRDAYNKVAVDEASRREHAVGSR